MTAERRGVAFWVGLVAGWALIGYGIGALLDNPDDTHPDRLARWFVGGVVAHHLVVAPFVSLVGWGLAQVLPRAARGAVAGGLVVSAAVLVYAWPSIGGYGERPDDPSALPQNYAAGAAATLGLVWLVTLILVWRRLRGRPQHPAAPSPRDTEQETSP